MASIFYLRTIEIRTGRQYLFFTPTNDVLLQRFLRSIKIFSRKWNLKTIKLLYYLLLEKLEKLLLSAYRFIRQKLDRPINMVKGQGQAIEDYKNSRFLETMREDKDLKEK